MIEVFLKKVNLYILPKIKSHLCLKKPASIFISRTSTVSELHLKVVEILYDNKKDFSIEELLDMSRIWRIDIGESVEDIERHFE